jgi:hypothetical protein
VLFPGVQAVGDIYLYCAVNPPPFGDTPDSQWGYVSQHTSFDRAVSNGNPRRNLASARSFVPPTVSLLG